MEECVNYRNGDKNEKNDAEKEAECPYNTSPDETEEGVNDENIEKNYEEKEAESPDDTPPVEMEEGINDDNIEK